MKTVCQTLKKTHRSIRHVPDAVLIGVIPLIIAPIISRPVVDGVGTGAVQSDLFNVLHEIVVPELIVSCGGKYLHSDVVVNQEILLINAS